jgi:aminopeptidase
MELEEYTRFIVNASTTDPRPLLDAERRIEPLFEAGAALRIDTRDSTDGRLLTLTMDISQSRAVLSYGLRNFPDGEIFTSPDARTPEGEIFVDLPVNYGGNDIQGIYLRFEKGRIVEYRAQQGHDHLAAIIETDDGSHRLGEVALGMNPGLDRVLKHPLFVEKVGGTLHIAIGGSYEDCYVSDPGSSEGKARIEELERSGALNRSAQHVDIVTDFREGGCGRRVLIDDNELLPRDGLWVPAS